SELHVLKLWSGRRESNPRPTAWKAVTLPLSYSRELLTTQQLIEPLLPYQPTSDARESRASQCVKQANLGPLTSTSETGFCRPAYSRFPHPSSSRPALQARYTRLKPALSAAK